jgi:hypothetical protein
VSNRTLTSEKNGWLTKDRVSDAQILRATSIIKNEPALEFIRKTVFDKRIITDAREG